MTTNDFDPSPDPTTEIGGVGLRRSGGIVTEEFLTDLQGTRGIETYLEMWSNDPIVGATITGLEMLLRSVSWRVEAGGNDPLDLRAADHVTTCQDDMTHTWPEFISDAASMLPFGWAWHEQVFKTRNGPQAPLTPTDTDPTYSSDYNDGLVGWAKLPIRQQETLDEWVFHDPSDTVLAMRQSPPPDYRTRTIPRTKSLHFRGTAARGNPHGRSVLRAAYRPWYFKRRIEESEAIGIDRDLAGFPVVEIPERYFRSTATADEQATLRDWQEFVRDLRRDELEGAAIPRAFDGNNNELYRLTLLSTGGSRQIDPSATIVRKNQEIATAALADFLLIGHEKVGSFALAGTKKELLGLAVDGWALSLAEEINRSGISALMIMNPVFNGAAPPRIVPQTVGEIDLSELADYIRTLADVGYPLFPDETLGRFLLKVADLPEPGPDELIFDNPLEQPTE